MLVNISSLVLNYAGGVAQTQISLYEYTLKMVH